MLVNTKAIVLSAIKYGDTSLIAKIFTQTDGVRSYLLKGVLSSKRGKLKSAYFQPLVQLEIQAFHKNKGTLKSIREAKVSYHYQSIHANVAKNALAFFLAEMLSNSIGEEEPNEVLFSFIEHALQWLDTHDEMANFHLYFLLTLTKYLGFYPDTQNREFPYFDLLEGEFIKSPSLNPNLSGENIFYFNSLLGTDFDGLAAVKMKKSTRQDLLKNLVHYFELHLQGFRKPKSLAVLNEVFG
ncbi:DNA replication and repair protein RecO [Arenibacter nanhaiticus]|uniref:DNA repair protein RecO n=1 Tax=Arenibacter nanhaiticus TaxID=558155 RepID=A0A1M6D443_9FLAO|nr:DNA repair protein RecO [Arenibacter nanhaiticus]SHI67969.1 DNA replication and repair protein RecO [Arenibacter nanhaiticus]